MLGFLQSPPRKNKNIDLFEKYNELPKEVRKVIDKYSELIISYEDCEQFCIELESLGYTFEYYLDAQPFNLTKL